MTRIDDNYSTTNFLFLNNKLRNYYFFPAVAIVIRAHIEWTLYKLHVACVKVYDGVMKLQQKILSRKNHTRKKKKLYKLERR